MDPNQNVPTEKTIAQLEDIAARFHLKVFAANNNLTAGDTQALTASYLVLQKGILLRKLNSLLTEANAVAFLAAVEAKVKEAKKA